MTARAALRAAAGAAVVLLAGGACSAVDGPRVAAPLEGHQITVLATWAGVEQQRFGRVLDAFEQQTGAQVSYASSGHGMPAALAERFAAGDPPDVAFLPQPGLLVQLARQGRLQPLDSDTADLVGEHFAPALTKLGSYDGRLYGVWFKAANKSLIWYDVATFEAAGAVAPRNLESLRLLVDQLADKGIAAFAVSAASGWTLTDWFENLYLRTAGRRAYDDLAAHRIPWTDQTVIRTLRLMSELLAPGHIAGGVATALRTKFEASVRQVFTPPSHAAMVAEGDFVAGAVTGWTPAVLGVDADAFPFPAGPDGVPVVVGGGDVAVLLRPSIAGAELLRYLATPDAAAIWAAAGGFLSPNLDLDLSVYPDDLSRKNARQLLEAGPDFRFDLSDLQPSAFGGSDDYGMRAALRSFLVSRDVAATATRLEREAAAAYEVAR